MGTRETNVSKEETAIARGGRRAADQRGPGAAAGIHNSCRMFGSGGVFSSNSGGGGHHGHLAGNMPRPWQWGEGWRVSAQYSRCCPSRNTSEFGKGRWNNMPQQVFASSADPTAEGRIEMFQSRQGPPDNPSGKGWPREITECHLYAGR